MRQHGQVERLQIVPTNFGAFRPGSFTRRSINFLSTLEKVDAEYFELLCRFTITLAGNVNALVLSYMDGIYMTAGITYEKLQHLANIGLISFQPVGSHELHELSGCLSGAYFGINFEFRSPQSLFQVDVGAVFFSDIGRQLAVLSNAKPVPGFLEYVANEWKSAHNATLTQL